MYRPASLGSRPKVSGRSGHGGRTHRRPRPSPNSMRGSASYARIWASTTGRASSESRCTGSTRRPVRRGGCRPGRRSTGVTRRPRLRRPVTRPRYGTPGRAAPARQPPRGYPARLPQDQHQLRGTEGLVTPRSEGRRLTGQRRKLCSTSRWGRGRSARRGTADSRQCGPVGQRRSLACPHRRAPSPVHRGHYDHQRSQPGRRPHRVTKTSCDVTIFS